jgi:hypothetical protein
VVGKKQEPEPDLGDEEGLREGEQMRDEPARLTVAVVRDASEDGRGPGDAEDEECDGVVGR